MSNVATIERKSILSTMAHRYDMEPAAFEQTLRNTVAKPGKDGKAISREEFAACLVVANQYNLNPLTKEIYFFPDSKRGGIVPVLGVDGWCRIINEHPQFDGMDFTTEFDERGKPFSIECRMYRKDRAHPVSVVEFLSECVRDTDPWKKSPARMLRHKAMIQAARYAFGFSGLHDEDDADFIVNGSTPRNVTQLSTRRPAPLPPPPPPAPTPTPTPAIDTSIPEHMQVHDQSETEVWDDTPHDEETGEIVDENPVLSKAREKAMEGTKRLKLYLAKLAPDDAAKIIDEIEALNSAAALADQNLLASG